MRFADSLAAVATVIIYYPFRSSEWGIYAGICMGYSVYVVGHMFIKDRSFFPRLGNEISISAVAITHMASIAAVLAWVWVWIFMKPYLPDFMVAKFRGRADFGHAILGLCGLFAIAAVEQLWLVPEQKNEDSGESAKPASLPVTNDESISQ
jgi:hypothetical protein